MSPKLKAFLVAASKSAINAVFTNGVLMMGWSSVFNLHDWAGVKHLLGATGMAILAREAAVFVPKILAWSTSTTEEREVAALKQQAIANIKAAPEVPKSGF